MGRSARLRNASGRVALQLQYLSIIIYRNSTAGRRAALNGYIYTNNVLSSCTLRSGGTALAADIDSRMTTKVILEFVVSVGFRTYRQ